MTDPVDDADPTTDEPAAVDAELRDRANNKVIWALITAATLILTLSAVNTWVERQLLETDNWVDSSTALLENDDLRHEIAIYLVNEVYSSVDVGDALAERLPENLVGLSGPAASVLRDPLVDAVDIVLQSRAVQELWRDANEIAHSRAIAILEDDVGPNVSTADGSVTLDLGRLVTKVGGELGISSERLDQIPEGAGTVTIVEFDTLEAAQTAVAAIKVMSVVLFLLVAILYAAAIYLASDWRREAIRSVGMAIAFSGFVLLVIVRVSTGWVVDGAATESGRTVARTVLPIATDLLGRLAWAVLFVGLLIWLFAVLTGTSRAAEHVQRVSAAGFRRQAVAMWSGVAALTLLVLAWGPLSTAASWLGVVFIVIVIVAGVEAIRRTSLARQP